MVAISTLFPFKVYKRKKEVIEVKKESGIELVKLGVEYSIIPCLSGMDWPRQI